MYNACVVFVRLNGDVYSSTAATVWRPWAAHVWAGWPWAVSLHSDCVDCQKRDMELSRLHPG